MVFPGGIGSETLKAMPAPLCFPDHFKYYTILGIYRRVEVLYPSLKPWVICCKSDWLIFLQARPHSICRGATILRVENFSEKSQGRYQKSSYTPQEKFASASGAGAVQGGFISHRWNRRVGRRARGIQGIAGQPS
jgi:hypothetical protein